MQHDLADRHFKHMKK